MAQTDPLDDTINPCENCIICLFGNEPCVCGEDEDENISYDDERYHCEHINTTFDNEGFEVCEDCGAEI